MYTRAIVSFNLFVQIDEDSRLKYLHNEDRRLEYMLEYDHIALDALNALENCLSEWPTLIDGQYNFKISK